MNLKRKEYHNCYVYTAERNLQFIPLQLNLVGHLLSPLTKLLRDRPSVLATQLAALDEAALSKSSSRR